MVEYQVAKYLRTGFRHACLALLLASCGETTTPDNGSETHFLLRCFDSCEQGFECLSGVCTRACEADVDCSDLDDAAVCAEAGAGCRVLCESDQDCTAEHEDWLCDSGQCVSSKPPVDSSPSECPLFDGGVQEPSIRQTSQADIPGSGDVRTAVADGTGLFWQEADGAVRAFTDAETVELSPSVLDSVISPMGVVTDDTTVYFAEAGPPRMSPPEEPGPPPPPGLLYAVPKAGGEVELLLELDDAIITPLAVTDQGIVILSDQRVYVVSDDGVELLEHIPPISESHDFHVADGRAYWSDWPLVREPTQLYAVDLEGGEPEVIIEINGTFIVGHGRVLVETETLAEDPLVLVNELTMLDLETGCLTELPSRGESMGTPVLDARHVYWKSYNGSEDGGEDACLDPLPLLRVNLTNGTFEELPVDGFDVTICSDFFAQDDDKLYMRTWPGHSLVAIDKP